MTEWSQRPLSNCTLKSDKRHREWGERFKNYCVSFTKKSAEDSCSCVTFLRGIICKDENLNQKAPPETHFSWNDQCESTFVKISFCADLLQPVDVPLISDRNKISQISGASFKDTLQRNQFTRSDARFKFNFGAKILHQMGPSRSP